MCGNWRSILKNRPLRSNQAIYTWQVLLKLVNCYCASPCYSNRRWSPIIRRGISQFMDSVCVVSDAIHSHPLLGSVHSTDQYILRGHQRCPLGLERANLCMHFTCAILVHFQLVILGGLMGRGLVFHVWVYLWGLSSSGIRYILLLHSRIKYINYTLRAEVLTPLSCPV